MGKVGFIFALSHSITLTTLHWTFSRHSQVNMPSKQYLAILIDCEKACIQNKGHCTQESETFVLKKIRIRFDFLSFRIRCMHFDRKGWGIRKNARENIGHMCNDLKGIVHPKMKILSFTHPQVDPNLYECLCSEHKGRCFEESL